MVGEVLLQTLVPPHSQAAWKSHLSTAGDGRMGGLLSFPLDKNKTAAFLIFSSN